MTAAAPKPKGKPGRKPGGHNRRFIASELARLIAEVQVIDTSPDTDNKILLGCYQHTSAAIMQVSKVLFEWARTIDPQQLDAKAAADFASTMVPLAKLNQTLREQVDRVRFMSARGLGTTSEPVDDEEEDALATVGNAHPDLDEAADRLERLGLSAKVKAR